MPAPEAAPGEVAVVPPVVWARATDAASASVAVINSVRISVSCISLTVDCCVGETRHGTAGESPALQRHRFPYKIGWDLWQGLLAVELGNPGAAREFEGRGEIFPEAKAPPIF